MGSTVILVGAVALGTGLVCLICGYLWGRSNVRSQIEDALDKARISADAREFSVREELDDRMLELADLRARAEELPRLREQVEQLTSERTRGSAGGRVFAYAPENNAPTEEKPPEKVQHQVPVPESTDKTIQNLLKSIEERMNQTNSRDTVQESTTPAVTKFAVEIPPTVTQLSSKPVPAELPAAKPAPAVKDEWQEFAASLTTLRNRQK
ncbi:MAG TPA: hypothetical protein VK574_08620 [Terracidiphilus sp.]|nr:hypothetical protein [Terracidiphilus sp.]